MYILLNSSALFLTNRLNTLNSQEVCATRFESRAIIEAEAEYLKGPFHKYFAYRRYSVVALRVYIFFTL